MSGEWFGDAALAHIVDGLVVELSDGRAVGTFDIVGVDFELRTGENMRCVGELQVAILK